MKQLWYFSADWCGPCKQLKSNTLKDRGVLARLNKCNWYILDVDKEKSIAKRYGITGMPTTKVLKGDKAVKSKTGYMSPREMISFLP